MRYEGMVYRPPSEARSLILQVTIGCAHNRCTFCTMYKEKTFRLRTMEEIYADICEVSGQTGGHAGKIFLADGDALVLPARKLLQILEWLHLYFPDAGRITAYGAPRDVLQKTPAELKALRQAGLDMVYIGLESGDDAVLTFVNKGASSSEIITAVQKLSDAGIRTSVTLISGLGGKERLAEHASASAAAVSSMRPDYLGFLTLLSDPAALIAQDIRAGRMHLLEPEDVMREMEIFLTEVDAPGTVFRANHASNYLLLKGTLNDDIPAMLDQVRDARAYHAFREENRRAL